MTSTRSTSIRCSDLIERFVDFDAVRACKDVQLFISATNVQTGRLRIFPREEMTADVIMASACLPILFRAVEIDGVPYWDGGYMGNPALYPVLRRDADRGRADRADQSAASASNAHTQTEIMTRINEITFNSSLMRNCAGNHFVGKLIDQGKLPRGIGTGEISPHQRAPHRAHRRGTDPGHCQPAQHRL